MESKIVLRQATPEDFEAVLSVQHLSPGAARWTAADYESVFDAEGTVFLLAVDPLRERLAGFLLAGTVADEMEVLNLAVAPDYRRRGIGRNLLTHVLAQGQAEGISQCWLEVRASNRAARYFYRALGFIESGRRPRYYRNPVEDAVVCVRQLVAAAPGSLKRSRGCATVQGEPVKIRASSGQAFRC